MKKILCFYLTIVLASCKGHSEPKHTNARLQFFDIDLLAFSAQKKGNVMISPASVKSTLLMLMEGSESETRDEIRRALRLSSDKQEAVDQTGLYLSVLQENSTGVTLESANGLFVSNKLTPKKDFLDKLQNQYKSELRAVNFTEPGVVAKTVNGWVSNKTLGLIPELLDTGSISPSSSMLVLNALYFKGQWKFAFHPLKTRPKCFYKNDKCVQVVTMQQHVELKYAFVDELNAHALELPYEGERFSAIVLVPTEKDGCEMMVRDLPHVSLEDIVEQLEPTDVQLSLPRFTVDHTEDLVKALKEGRINSLFSSSARLSGVFEGDSRHCRVDSVLQRVRAQVSEAGTVAAAATGAVVVPLIGSATNTVRLSVDRPFLFFIRDALSGAIIFEGKIEDPEVAPPEMVAAALTKYLRLST